MTEECIQLFNYFLEMRVSSFYLPSTFSLQNCVGKLQLCHDGLLQNIANAYHLFSAKTHMREAKNDPSSQGEKYLASDLTKQPLLA